MSTPSEVLTPKLDVRDCCRPDPLSGIVSTRAGRWLVPSLSDLLFIALFVWLFLAGSDGLQGLLLDADIGWHIRTGEWILDNGKVPQTDLFTFTKPDAPWFAWEWLSDIVFAEAHRGTGLKGVVMIAAIVIAAWPVVLLRHALWRGANLWTALVAVLLGVGAASIHFLGRPHIFTLLFTSVAVWFIEADRRQPGRRVWLLVPLTLVWTNLHGGFVVVIGLLGLTAAGSLAEWLWGRGERGTPIRFAALAAICSAVSMVNPYGLGLHAHIWAYLRSDWIRNVVQEFQAPNFRSENLMHYEVLLIGALLMAGRLVAQKKFVHALWFVAFAHLSLSSIRHVPVFIAVVAPIVAGCAAEVWTLVVMKTRKGSTLWIFDRVGLDVVAGFGRISVWPAFFLIGVWCTPGLARWPGDFPSVQLPTALIHTYGETISKSRVLTMDQWADYLIYCNYPKQRVFADGRSDFLGPDLGNEYIRAVQGDYRWNDILGKYRVNLVLAPLEWPLTTILKQSRDWQIMADDGHAVLFTRISR